MKRTVSSANGGMALVAALLFITLALIVLGALSIRLVGQTRVVEHYESYKDCFQGLEAALAASVTEVEKGEDGIIGMDGWVAEYDENNAFVFPDLDGGAVSPASMDSMPNVEFAAYAVNWFTDGRDSNGDTIVDSVEERFMWSICAAAQHGESQRQAEVVYEGKDVNVWRNAIFAGSGQAGGLINGNVSIHGSVHLLGDGLVAGGVALAALDLSGTSLIHNNYEGLDPTLRERVPELDETLFNGEAVHTLEANLRVKNGLVGMSGNSEIGEPDMAGDDIKETMDGTYVADGWTGNSVLDDGDRGDSTAVFSDNGWDEGYDLGDKVAFPVLTDDWRDPNDGSRVQDPATGVWYTHEDYFSQVLVADENDPVDGVYSGNIVLNARGTSFYWNATTGEELSGADAEAATPNPSDDYIQFNAGANTLLMNGQIRVDGTLTFKGQGNDTTINYSGRAAMLVYGNVTIDANLLACNNGDPTDTIESFPANNIIGIMASQDMMVGSTSQLEIMGAFYAQGKITAQKQTDVMGTFVSNYFDMGTNVPSIYQVPDLADNLPLGMIGNYPILALSRVSWREVGG